MARLTVGQKAQRLLAFLMGLGNPANLRALQPYGFGPAEHEEGWTLLRRAATNRLAAPRVGATATTEQIDRVVCMTPLGSPVVPLVKLTSITSSTPWA